MIICTTVSLVSVPTAWFGYIRDEIYVNKCDVGEITRNEKIVEVHAALKAFVLFSTIAIALSAANILYSAKSRWDKARGKDKVVIEWNGEEDKLEEEMEKFYHLYNNYIKVGKDTDKERKTLRRWFVGIYLIFVVIRLVHTTRILSKEWQTEHPVPDIVHSVLTVFLHLVAFFIPYYMAADLNTAHHNYLQGNERHLLENKDCAPIP